MILYLEDVTLSRWAAGTYVSGSFVNGVLSTSTIRVNEQPVTEHQLQRLPEGARQRGVKAWITKSEVRAANQAAATVSDRITNADGTVFEVDLVDHYARGPLAHYEVLATRVLEAG